MEGVFVHVHLCFSLPAIFHTSPAASLTVPYLLVYRHGGKSTEMDGRVKLSSPFLTTLSLMPSERGFLKRQGVLLGDSYSYLHVMCSFPSEIALLEDGLWAGGLPSYSNLLHLIHVTVNVENFKVQYFHCSTRNSILFKPG